MARILIVDDQSLILMTIHEALKNTGHQIVDEAGSGQESIEKARLHKPDLILMDINMPGEIDGIGAARIINEEMKIPIIFITAYSTPDYLRKLKEISSFGYIVKPFQRYQLEMSIEIALYRNKMEKLLEKSIKKEKEKVLQERIIYFLLTESNKILNPYEKMQDNLNFICQYMKFKIAAFYEYNENVLTQTFTASPENEKIGIDEEFKTLQLSEEQLEILKRPSLFSNLSLLPEKYRDFITRNQIISFISFPVFVDQKFKGALFFFNTQEKYRFLLRFLKIISNITSITLKRYQDYLQLQEHERQKLEREKMLFELQRLASMGELSSAINHEISQPLQSIKVLSDSIIYWDQQNKKPAYDTMLNNFRKISSRVEKIDKIIKNMNLLFKSPEKMELENVYVNLVAVSVVNLFEDRLKSSGIQIILDLDENLAELYSSPIQIQQVITNLVKNAINALNTISKANKRIMIQTKENKDFILLKISDNGPGIPEEIQDKIFKPFFSTFQTSSSMGMGLYIVQNILKSLNASIDVGNNPEGGAYFKISLNRTRQ